MLKNTVTGSMLAKLFPTMSKYFLENASQEEVNKAEQEAATVHQQLSAGTEGSTEAGATENPTPAGAGTTTVPASAELTAMTTRATAAEEKVTALQGKLTAAEADRDKYKPWYDKQAAKGTALPGADATARGGSDESSNLSAASAAGLAAFRKSKG